MDELERIAMLVQDRLEKRSPESARTIRYPIASMSRSDLLALRDEVKRRRPEDTVASCCDASVCENEFAWIDITRPQAQTL